MPQIQRKTGPTATTIKESKPFRDRLRDRYAPSEYVRVINIDDQPYEWQYFPTAGEDVSFTDNGNVRVVEGRQRFTKNYEQVIPGNEQTWVINPGNSEVLVGENADLFIEGLYKRLVAKQRFLDDPIKESDRENVKVRKFNWNDGLLQEQMIDKIYLGKAEPNFDESRPSTAGAKK
jgi:hypothetical protein